MIRAAVADRDELLPEQASGWVAGLDPAFASDPFGLALVGRRTGDWCFFQVRVGRASKAELAYLAAMASLGAGPYRSGEIAAALGRPGPESVAPTRARLIEKGLIYSPAYGLNEFTVPHVDAAKLPARAAESFSVTVAMWPRPGSLASSCPRGHSGARVRQHRRG